MLVTEGTGITAFFASLGRHCRRFGGKYRLLGWRIAFNKQKILKSSSMTLQLLRIFDAVDGT